MRTASRGFQSRKVNGRIRVLLAGLLAWALLLAGRLVQLQVFGHAAAKAEVMEQSRSQAEIFPERGTVFDRSGTILARSIPARSLFLTPVKGENAEARAKTIRAASRALGLSSEEIQRLLGRARQAEPFLYIKRKPSPEAAAAVEALNLPGVHSHADTMRFYPNGRLAAHVLGGVGLDDTGLAGVEYAHNQPLQGRKGQALILKDARRRAYHFETLVPALPGQDIVLTIDATLQYIAERELNRAIEATGSNWGAVIISHPGTGEILAMASAPTYDPNAYSSAGAEAQFNRAIQLTYEPGSTFKVVTASAALARHAVGLKETFDCSRADLGFPGKPIRDHKPFGVLTFPEVVIHSSNRGMALVGRRVGEVPMFDMAAAFGFGRKTGIDLSGEAAGRLQPMSAWSRRTLAALSIGYEVASTPLQVLMAVNAVANKGILWPPRVVKDIRDPARPLQRPAPVVALQVLAPEVAATLTGILEEAVEEGTGHEARLDGYRVAGKTGTTQKRDPALGAYSERKHIASFVGFAPADNPALSVIVVLDEPKGTAYYGGEVAAPVFREIVRKALLHLGVYPASAPVQGLITASVRSEVWR